MKYAEPITETGDAADRRSGGHHRIAIIGAGFAGLGMAIRCQQAGIGDWILLEAADDVGGTWRDPTRIRTASATCPPTCTPSRSP
jgi:cation diffusion facilitator CzcD-associated flavoprotein CzcO